MRSSLAPIFRLAVLLLLPGMAACQFQEADMPGEGGIPFEVFVPTGETRTVTDGMQTCWLTGDRLSVFHAPAGSAAYVSDGPFTVDDPATGHAAGTVYNLVTDGASDWYLVYPNKASNTRPDKLTLNLGSAFGSAQVQQGYNTTSHLSGETFPLWGKERVVTAGGVVPSVQMHPLLAAIGVRVTNESKGAIRLQNVYFTAPVPLMGSFSVNITGEQPVITPLSASNTATLSIADAPQLAVGETATLYLGVCPFTAGAGEDLTLEVKALDTSSQEMASSRTITLEKVVNFTAGHIKYLNMSFSGPEDPFLSGSTQGVYNLNGKDYVYEAGRDQISTRRSIVDGTVSFRILTPATKTALEVKEIPTSLTEGQNVSLTLSFYEGAQKISEQSLAVTVLKVVDKLAWCKTEDGVGIILNFDM